ncbi:hypothetical protein HQQ94_13445 [Shewanella sp. VB17]|uniref:hypothetical protein n=1 Tax=Shewanella sp. VB17 TaxID=2739432 RepID=UPI00156728B5|nr:hypothetical protein [Shewanella sp. VB17]NRD74222.1 hypothetical protein [Shewanella sp. VB17]
MKKHNFTLLASIYACTFFIASTHAANPVIHDDNNPFITEQAPNSQLEPSGLIVYSFAEHPNKLTASADGTDYITQAKETKEYGFTLVHSSQIRQFDKVIRHYKDGDMEFKQTFKRPILANQSHIDAQKHSMSFAGNVASLDQALNGKFELLHSSLGGNFIPGKGWDQLSKIVKSKTLGHVIIDIMTFTKDSGLIMDQDAVNFYVNGNPGILIVMEDDSGRAETSLTWADNEKSYTVELDKNVNANNLMIPFKDLIQKISTHNIPMERL